MPVVRSSLTTRKLRAAATLVVLTLAAALLTHQAADAQEISCDVQISDPIEGSLSGDIAEACGLVDGTELSLAIRTQDRQERGWAAYVNADGREYDVVIEADGSGFRSVVTSRNTGALTCTGDATFGGDAWRYSSGLALSECFGGEDTTPLSVVWQSGSDVAPDDVAEEVATGDGDRDGDPDGDGPLAGGCTTQVADPLEGTLTGDIAEACAEYDGTTLDLSIRTQRYDRRPWSVDLIVDSQPFTAAVQVTNEGEARAIVTDSSDDVICEPDVAWGPGDEFRHIRNIDLDACFGATNLPISARWISGSDTAPDGAEDAPIEGGDGTGSLPGDPGEPGQPDEPGENPNPSSPTLPSAPDGLRLSGNSRFETSASVALYAWPDGAAEVYLARADNPADALSGGSLPYGPVLLVPTCDGIPDPIAAAITTLAPERVIALGGEAAVCQATLDAANAL